MPKSDLARSRIPDLSVLDLQDLRASELVSLYHSGHARSSDILLLDSSLAPDGASVEQVGHTKAVVALA